MSRLVLYRKYRPKSFAEVIGQEHVTRTLKGAILSDLLSHAYIFAGPRGSGKTTIARLLAKAVNCRKRSGHEPCLKCESCLEFENNRSLDLIEIDAASHRGIDDIRELKEGIKFSPNKEEYKVFIIDEAHQLTKEAVNALLKTLEEPPPHAIFILATTEIHKMLPTILSRCQRFDFRRLTPEEIVKRLEILSKYEKAKIDREALELIAVNANGGVRDAESLLDQILSYSSGKSISKTDVIRLLGLADIELVSRFVDILIQRDQKKAIKYLGDIFGEGSDPVELIKTLIGYLREMVILKVDSEAMISAKSQEEIGKLKEQAEKFTFKELSGLLKGLIEAENRMKYSSILELPLELAIIDFTLKEA